MFKQNRRRMMTYLGLQDRGVEVEIEYNFRTLSHLFRVTKGNSVLQVETGEAAFIFGSYEMLDLADVCHDWLEDVENG